MIAIAAVWNNRLGSALIEFFTQFGAIIGFVTEHPFRPLDPEDQAFCDQTVMRFASSQQNAIRRPLASASACIFGCALRASDQQPASAPLFRPLPSDAL
ncbi:hypothetical protein XI01_13965 [Bradyrhizobium sp. CCBAU 21360]|nr:hypothetical protein [Bradyrhizobium sp. CCBAU 21360]